ncbi:tyrosine-protein kinase transmembrane receptor Ror-like [Penaeus indicus]|uniref:tyrosine-protein kinase transmembrane receptor Ror-like n=1 Tax=Penaeus indicus TaxID=29960 RepID=UPI00300C7DA6
MDSQNPFSESGLTESDSKNRTILPVVSTIVPAVTTPQGNVTSMNLRKVPPTKETERKKSNQKVSQSDASSQRQVNKTTNPVPQRSKFSRAETPGTVFSAVDDDPDAVILCKDLDLCKHSSCHSRKEAESGFICICTDGVIVQPQEKCDNSHLDIDPSPVSIELSKSPDPVRPKKDQSHPLSVLVIAFLLVMILLAFVYWRRKTLVTLLRQRHRDKKSGQQSPVSLAKSQSLLTYNFASNPNYYAQAPDSLPFHTLGVHLIDKEQIAFIGEGKYGPRCPENLVGGNASGAESGMSVTVAVKVPKDCAGVEAEADFMREVEIMSAFRHENIVTLIGIVATDAGGRPWMVFEFMPYGDLAEVLRSCNKQFYSNDSPVKSLGKPPLRPIHQEDLLSMSVQIASGMEYLSSQHFVHRDLACRNCLVGENLCVKISDFGMSRDVYTCDYYKPSSSSQVGGSRMLPVRWMAPESIMYGKFTLESDVWSFGVVLWEIYSFGKQPYYGNSNEHSCDYCRYPVKANMENVAQFCTQSKRCQLWNDEFTIAVSEGSQLKLIPPVPKSFPPLLLPPSLACFLWDPPLPSEPTYKCIHART